MKRTAKPGGEHTALRLRLRLVLLVVVAGLSAGGVLSASAYNLIDNWGENIIWQDPDGVSSALASVEDTYYNYPGTSDHNYYNTAEHWDDGCGWRVRRLRSYGYF